MLLLAVSGPRLFGREKEIEQLWNALSCRNSVTCVKGEAGIGKSALLDEFQMREGFVARTFHIPIDIDDDGNKNSRFP